MISEQFIHIYKNIFKNREGTEMYIINYELRFSLHLNRLPQVDFQARGARWSW